MTETKCVRCARPHPRRTRGCCPNCYAYLHAQVTAFRTTWEKLEAAGLCRRAVPPGERRSGLNFGKKEG